VHPFVIVEIISYIDKKIPAMPGFFVVGINQQPYRLSTIRSATQPLAVGYFTK
jgi:hypothetical protein